MRPPRAIKASAEYGLTRMMGARPSRPPNSTIVADRLARRGNDAHGGGLAVDHADGRFVRDDGGNRLRRRIARERRSCPDPPSRRRSSPPAFPWLSAAAARRRESCPTSSLTGINAPERPPTWRRGHHAALFHRVVEQRQRRGRAVACRRPQGPSPPECAPRESPIAGRGRQRKIHDAERHVQPRGRLPRHQLTHARDLERRAFDRLGHHVERLALRRFSSARLTTPGPETPTLMTQSALARRRGTRPP